MNSPPYGNGGLTAETIVFPVRIIMSPISSKNPLAGAVARSAAPRTTVLLLSLSTPRGNVVLLPGDRNTTSTSRITRKHLLGRPGARAVPAAVAGRSPVVASPTVRARVRMVPRGAAIAAALLAATVASGCGGGDRQDVNEPDATYKVQVVARAVPAAAGPRRDRALLAWRSATRGPRRSRTSR